MHIPESTPQTFFLFCSKILCGVHSVNVINGNVTTEPSLAAVLTRSKHYNWIVFAWTSYNWNQQIKPAIKPYSKFKSVSFVFSIGGEKQIQDYSRFTFMRTIRKELDHSFFLRLKLKKRTSRRPVLRACHDVLLHNSNSQQLIERRTAV